MKYLKIQNKGELDIRLVALMGGSTKTNDRYKIGKFGTGLKYTLAFLFRNNLSFKIFSGGSPIDISLEVENINEEDFEIICINKNRTSITTKMGLEWSAWMILRELWCNALDEGDALKESLNCDDVNTLIGDKGKTTFYIQIDKEINEVLENWKSYFIQDEVPLFENNEYAIYKNDSYLKLYKQGILIYQDPNPKNKSLFKYDIKNADINELREFKGSVNFSIFEALRSPNQETITYFFTNIREDHYEGCQLDYGWFSGFSDIWKNTIGKRKISYSGGSYLTSSVADENMENVINLPQRVYQALTKQFEGIGAICSSDNKHDFFEIKNIHMENKINDTLLFLINSGYEYDTDINFITGMFVDKYESGTNRKENKILISNLCISMDMFKLSCILIKEIEKIKIKVNDNLENHFIELYSNLLVKNNIIERGITQS